jgi:hypothetical protein
MQWILANKQWLFSGVLVAVPLAAMGWLLAKRSISQRQKGGKGSTNVQVGRDFTVNKRSPDD